MKQIHFIAIGGSAMHNLAIALSRKGEQVTGSDDEIFEPSKTRLSRQGILPTAMGWFPEKIHKNLDAIILGMHARIDNPELLRAKELNLPIYSYPEYLYEQSKDKIRVVIGGSHGKTTITAMILHVAAKLGLNVDYMVGAQLEGYDCMVQLSSDAPYMILEGDEYLSSPIDRRPKFHLYQPHIALVSGIAWDHINVFPSFENYVEQFEKFCKQIDDQGCLVYNAEDTVVKRLGEQESKRIKTWAYQTPKYESGADGTLVAYEGKTYPLTIFGAHNLQNVMGALGVCQQMNITPVDFLKAMQDFSGAGKRLEKITATEKLVLFKDFAHSPSKLKATTQAVKEQYPSHKLIACMELHTFSSLTKAFLPLYANTMAAADEALVYFNPVVVQHKKLPELSELEVKEAFNGEVRVCTTTEAVIEFITQELEDKVVVLMMSSGNFDGIDYQELGEHLLAFGKD